MQPSPGRPLLSTPVRVAVIGAGIMGADHVTTLHRFVSGAEVMAVADVDLARAEHAVAGLIGALDGAYATTDPLAAIADPRVDAVLIASHDSTHAEFVLAAVRAGKPVLAEKPLTPSLDESLRLRDAVADRAGLVSLGFMRRFDPGYAQLKAAIDRRAIGRPLMLHCISRGVSSAPGTTTEAAVTGSTVHEFDVVPWLLGSPVVEVSWQAPPSTTLIADRPDGLRDPQLILLRTADGVLSICENFMNAGYGYDIRCEVVGETGTTSLVEPVTVLTDRDRGRSIEYGADWRPRFAEAYRLELQAWIDGLRLGPVQDSSVPDPSVQAPSAQGRPVLASFEDGVRASAVAQAVIESMHADGKFTKVLATEASATRVSVTRPSTSQPSVTQPSVTQPSEGAAE